MPLLLYHRTDYHENQGQSENAREAHLPGPLIKFSVLENMALERILYMHRIAFRILLQVT
jgi:hypothetical protein